MKIIHTFACTILFALIYVKEIVRYELVTPKKANLFDDNSLETFSNRCLPLKDLHDIKITHPKDNTPRNFNKSFLSPLLLLSPNCKLYPYLPD